MNRKTLISVILFLFIILFFCFTYFRGQMQQGPHGIHAWAQADRLSLAINFYDRGMNFFLPATHSQFATYGIVGVEFPIQAYMAAALGKIFGREHISTLFRLLNILISCAGVLGLFVACYRATKDFFISVVPPLFVFCSPVFLYYTANYLPDTASASLVFAGFYFLIRYQAQATLKDMLLVMLLLTLASLIKTSAAIYLLAFVGYVTVQRLFPSRPGKKHDAVFILSVVLSAAALIGYFEYNQYLNTRYQSALFLSQALPFSGLAEAREFIVGPFKNTWINEYFLEGQYLILAGTGLAAFPLLFRTAAGKKQLLYLFISGIGALVVFWLMGKQLFVHDYYSIVILLPAVVYWLTISMMAIRKSLDNEGLVPLHISIAVGMTILFCFADFRLHQRFVPGYKNLGGELPWSVNGDKLMQQLHIPHSDNILVLNEYAPNLDLLYFDRRGFNLQPGSWNNMGEVAAHMDGLKVDIGVCREELGQKFLTDSIFKNNFTMLAMQEGKVVFKAKK